MFLVATKSTRYKIWARCKSHRSGIDGPFDAAEGCTLRLHADTTGRRDLAGSQPVDLVVHCDIEQIHIAPQGVNEMIAANAETVAVAAGNHDDEVMIGELDARCNGQGAAVQRMHAIGIDIAGKI